MSLQGAPRLLLLLLTLLTLVLAQTTTSPDTVLPPRLDTLCKLPVNDYYCCKFKDPSVDLDLRCQFLLMVLDEPELCEQLLTE